MNYPALRQQCVQCVCFGDVGDVNELCECVKCVKKRRERGEWERSGKWRELRSGKCRVQV